MLAADTRKGRYLVEHTTETPAVLRLQSYFLHNGILLCNENASLPSLNDVGGDWNAIVTLMERGEVFYSKFFKGRVTYLSAGLYWQLKPYRQKAAKISPDAARVYDAIMALWQATAQQVQELLLLPKKTCTVCFDELFSQLLITVNCRERIIAENWCTFYYAPYSVWEQKPGAVAAFCPPDADIAREMLSPYYSIRQLDALLSTDTNK